MTYQKKTNRVGHGMRGTAEYQAYCDAKNRCTSPKAKAWPDYGGRGIKFLFESFNQFFAEIGARPADFSLDRKDNDGNYAPGNVHWVPRNKQMLNRRKPVMTPERLQQLAAARAARQFPINKTTLEINNPNTTTHTSDDRHTTQHTTCDAIQAQPRRWPPGLTYHRD